MDKKIGLKDVFDLLYVNRSKYKELSLEDKKTYGFIVNRHLSRKHIDFAQLLNIKQGDTSLVLDMWFLYLRVHTDTYYNKWIWYGKKESDNKLPTKSEIDYLVHMYHISYRDVIFMSKYLKEDLKELIDNI